MRRHFVIRVSWLWLWFVPLLAMSGFIRIYLDVFWMLALHECAHMLAALCCAMKLEYVKLYPFGLCAGICDLGLMDPLKELLVALAGPLSHLLIYQLLSFLHAQGIYSQAYCDYLQDVCVGLAIFNLLPVYPLDGSRVLLSLLHMMLPFARAQQLFLWFSIGSWVVFLPIWICSITTALFAMMSLILLWKLHQSRYELRLSFYAYRRFAKPLKRLKRHAQDDLYRGYDNQIWKGNHYLSEAQWLCEKLGKW